MRRLLKLGTVLTTLALAACGGTVRATDVGNMAPRARLSAPQNAPAGDQVLLDATASYDPDGTVVEYTFSFGDDTPQITQTLPEVSHSFAQPGAYEVAVIVRDDGGQLARATQLVVVRTDAPTCAAASECSLGAECRNSLCYTTEVGASTGAADCNVDTECNSGFTCRAGFCLSAQFGSR